MNGLLAVAELGREGIGRILERAAHFEAIAGRQVKKVPALRGKTVLNLFIEPSTRTRLSFELAAKRLSADVLNFQPGGSSLEKGESFKDTVLTLTAQRPDLIVVRAPWVGAAALVGQWSGVPVINGGDGAHEHPTQALLDLYVLQRALGSLAGRKVWIVGDVLHSRVARSTAAALTIMGAEVTLCGPPTLLPPDGKTLGAGLTFSLARLPEADAVYALRMQRERIARLPLPSLAEYAACYQITRERLRPGQLLLHAGPINRGVEVEGGLVEDPRSLVLDQVEAGVAVRMAVLYELLAPTAAPEPAPVGEVVA